MKYIKKFLSQLAFLGVGMVIVMISLMSANTVHSQGEDLEFGRRRLYLSNKIMPDHLLYPVVGGLDRLKLETSAPEMKPWMKFVYAQRRADYAEELLKKGYRGLAFSTLSKACKYHLEALVDLRAEGSLEGKLELMVKENEEFQKRVKLLKSSFNDADQNELNRLLAEQKVVLGR